MAETFEAAFKALFEARLTEMVDDHLGSTFLKALLEKHAETLIKGNSFRYSMERIIDTAISKELELYMAKQSTKQLIATRIPEILQEELEKSISKLCAKMTATVSGKHL